MSVDCSVEKWCQDSFLNHTSLLMADALRVELLDTLKRIELPVSLPAFGSRRNTFNVKRALLAGFFMQVRELKLYWATPPLTDQLLPAVTHQLTLQLL